MADIARPLMTPEEFLDWQRGQEQRFELVDGVPVEMMAGASGVHDTITTNIIALLRTQLRGTGCFVRSADTALRTKIRSMRRGDILVTCEPPRSDSYEALQPRLVVEVLSPGNVGRRWDSKLSEYHRHPKLEYILLVDGDAVGANLHVRIADGWDVIEAEALDDTIEMASLGCQLKLRDVYEETGLSSFK